MTRTTSRLRHRLMAGGALAGLVTAMPAAALAATPTAASTARVAYLHGRGDTEIQRRLATLAADATRLTDAQQKLDAALASIATHFASDQNIGQLKTKVDGDLQNLSGLVSTDEANLGTLKTTIDGDNNVQTLVPEVQSIVTAFRVYVLVDPKIHLTIAADRELVVAELLTDVEQVLTQKVNALPPTADGLADAKAALADMAPKVSDALSRAGQVAGAVAALQPAGYPANQPVLQANLTTVRQVRTELGQARADVARVRLDLHEKA